MLIIMQKHPNISSNHYKGIHQPCIKIAGVLVNLTVRLSSLSEWAEYKDLVPAVTRPGELILVLLDNACDSIRRATAYFRSVQKRLSTLLPGEYATSLEAQ